MKTREKQEKYILEKQFEETSNKFELVNYSLKEMQKNDDVKCQQIHREIHLRNTLKKKIEEIH